MTVCSPTLEIAYKSSKSTAISGLSTIFLAITVNFSSHSLGNQTRKLELLSLMTTRFKAGGAAPKSFQSARW